MPIVDRNVGRYSVLEIVEAEGRLVACRYSVSRHVEQGRDIASAETSEGPVEKLEL